MPEMGVKLGTIVMIFVIIGLFTLVIGTMPSGFFYGSQNWLGSTYPSQWTQEDIESFVYHENQTIDNHWFSYFDFRDNIPSFNVVFRASFWEIGGINYLDLDRQTWSLWIFASYESMFWVNNTERCSKAMALQYWDSDINASKISPIWDTASTVTIWLLDWNSSRNDLSQAWDEEKVVMEIGFGFDDIKVQYSAWDIFGQLVFFQAWEFMPEGTFGTIIHFIISGTFWACVGVIILFLIIELIPF